MDVGELFALAIESHILGQCRKFWGTTTGGLDDFIGQLDQQTRDQLAASPSQITLLNSKIDVTGREKSVPFAIRNVRQNTLTLAILPTCFDAIGPDSLRQTLQDAPNKIVNFESYKTTTIEGGKSDALLAFKIVMDASAPATVYKCKIDLEIEKELAPDNSEIQHATDAEKQYASQLFEIAYAR